MFLRSSSYAEKKRLNKTKKRNQQQRDTQFLIRLIFPSAEQFFHAPPAYSQWKHCEDDSQFKDDSFMRQLDVFYTPLLLENTFITKLIKSMKHHPFPSNIQITWLLLKLSDVKNVEHSSRMMESLTDVVIQLQYSTLFGRGWQTQLKHLFNCYKYPNKCIMSTQTKKECP